MALINVQFIKKMSNLTLLGLILLCFALVFHNFQLTKSINSLSKVKEEEFKAKIAKERDLISKEVIEKHASEMSSYNDLAKELESQKKLVKELENKVKIQPSTTHPAQRLKK